MQSPLEFDLPAYQAINHARELWLRRVVEQLPFRSQLKTALDVGCGAGHFAAVLNDMGFAVTGVDLQEENLRVCRSRHANIRFEPVNLDESFNLPKHDLVLLFGILYHLQSPLQTLQRLSQSIGRVALISTRVASGKQMAMYLFQEFQGAAHNTARVTAVPTLPALLAMFRQAGFEYLYLPGEQPDHPEWKFPRGQNGKRYSFVAAREPIHVAGWQRLQAGDFLRKWQPLHFAEKVRNRLARVLPFLLP